MPLFFPDREGLGLGAARQRTSCPVAPSFFSSVHLALNHTANPLQSDQLAEVHQAMETMFKRLYRSAIWFQRGLTTINGRAFFLLDLRRPALDTEIRNRMMGASRTPPLDQLQRHQTTRSPLAADG